MQYQCLQRLKTSNVLSWLPGPWSLNSSLTPPSISSVSSRALSSSWGPTEGRACPRTAMEGWSPVQKSGGSRCALLLSCRETCWLLPRNKGKSVTELCQEEETSRGAGEKGEWRANTVTSCCTLEEVWSWFVFFVCKEGSFEWTQQAATCQGNSKATRKPPCPYLPHTQYPTKAPLLTCSVSQSLNLYIKTDSVKRGQWCFGLPSMFSLPALLQFLCPSLI